MRKVTIVGIGRIIESTAQILAKEELCREIMLLDINDGVPQGVALDIQQSASLLRFDTRVAGSARPAAMTPRLRQLPPWLMLSATIGVVSCPVWLYWLENTIKTI